MFESFGRFIGLRCHNFASCLCFACIYIYIYIYIALRVAFKVGVLPEN